MKCIDIDGLAVAAQKERRRPQGECKPENVAAMRLAMFGVVVDKWDAGECTRAEAVAATGIPQSTFCRNANLYRERRGHWRARLRAIAEYVRSQELGDCWQEALRAIERHVNRKPIRPED